jgi:hypothetical protein
LTAYAATRAIFMEASWGIGFEFMRGRNETRRPHSRYLRRPRGTGQGPVSSADAGSHRVDFWNDPVGQFRTQGFVSNPVDHAGMRLISETPRRVFVIANGDGGVAAAVAATLAVEE